MALTKQEVKSKLYKVRCLNNCIRRYKERIQEEESKILNLGITYSDLPKPPKGYYENAHNKYLEKIEELNCKIDSAVESINEITEDFYALDDKHYKLLCMKYVEKLPWKEIKSITGYSVSSCERMEKEALYILGDISSLTIF